MSEVAEEQPTGIDTPEVTATITEVPPTEAPQEAPAAEEKPKPKRYVKKKVVPPAPTPEEPPTQTPIPSPTPEESPPPPAKVRAKAKPRAKKGAASQVFIDAVDMQMPPDDAPQVSEVPQPTEVPVTVMDTRTPQQRLAAMQQEMKKLRKDAKAVQYKRMLEGKI